MRESQPTETMRNGSGASCRVLETVYCPRDGRRVSVLFEFSGGPDSARTGIALCPLNTYSNRFVPSLGGAACEQACLVSR